MNNSMHVENITLHNVRQFRERQVSFRPGFNLLVGENGTGKTSLLRSLAVVLRANRHARGTPSMTNDDVRLGENDLRITALVSEERPEPWTLNYEKRLWGRARRDGRQHDWLVLLYSCNESVCSSFTSRKVKHYGVSPEAEELRRSEERLFEMDTPEIERRDDRAFGSSRKVRSFTNRILENFSDRFRRFYWVFEPYDCSVRYPEDGTEESLANAGVRDRIRAAVMRSIHQMNREGGPPYQWPDRREVSFDVEGFSRSESRREPPRNPAIPEALRMAKVSPKDISYLSKCEIVIRLTPRIVIQTELGPLRLRQLSDGEQRLFSLFVDIARQLSVQHPQMELGEGQAIVLIDEIDVHLHPKWQRKIVPSLEDLFRGCQFIATTHSPFVIQQVDRLHIQALEHGRLIPVDDNNTIEDIVEEIQGVKMPQRSVRKEKLSEAAQQYFKLLRHDRNVSAQELRDAEAKYREASEPYTSDPALHALLKIELLEKQ
jgi:predicted ATPase